MWYNPRIMEDELEFVDWLREQQRDQPGVILGVGDDMAIVDCGLRPAAPGSQADCGLCISSDMLLDGVHFDTKCHDLSLIGRKAVACSLSDCAAMAVRPLAATVSLALPAGGSLSDAQEMFQGMLAIAKEYGLSIVGGDTTRWKSEAGGLAIDVAVTATRFEGIEPVRRSGARPGDVLYVTGRLGGSLLGKHLTFTPRVREARLLAESMGDRLHAMIDVSDGLSLDLWRICLASGCGAVLDERRLQQVISDSAKTAADTDGRSPLDHALSDGEDYELLLAVSAEGAVTTDAVSLHPVGQVTDSGLWMRRINGQTEPLEPRGFVH